VRCLCATGPPGLLCTFPRRSRSLLPGLRLLATGLAAPGKRAGLVSGRVGQSVCSDLLRPSAHVLEVNRRCGRGLTPYPAVSGARCEHRGSWAFHGTEARRMVGWVRGQQAEAPLTGDHPMTSRDPQLPSLFLVSCEGSRPVGEVDAPYRCPVSSTKRWRGFLAYLGLFCSVHCS
jgi:hypothetical protein